MTKPIALQLYSIRDALTADFEGSLRRVADIGFAGVEFAGNYGTSPQSAAALCADLGLKISSAHMPMLIGDARPQAIDTAGALGINTLVCPWLPPDRFKTLSALQAVCDELSIALENAKSAGYRYAYHNHDFEFIPLEDGTLPHEYMRRTLDSSMLWEMDIYWVRHAGVDPVQVLTEVGSRTPLLHVKDGTGRADDQFKFVAAGEGIVDIPAAVHAAGDNVEWLIVELDNCATDMFEAVEKSFRYLVNQGLGHGR